MCTFKYTIILLSLFCCSVISQSKIQYGSNSQNGHYVHVNDIALYYEEYGTGRPLLLMHGNGGSISQFSKLIPLLSQRYRVIAVDTRAQGRSGDSGRELTFELIASDFKALLDSLHLDSVYAFGWSDGGIDGLQLAYSYPGSIAKLAMTGANFRADTTAFDDDFDSTKITWFRNLSPENQNRVIRSSHFPEKAGIIFDKLINLDLKYPHFTIQQLHAITIPALVMAGDHDVIKLSHTIELYRALPHSELCIVPHSHHAVPIEHPDLVRTILIDFFDTPFRDIR